jgi:hypothetical protein
MFRTSNVQSRRSFIFGRENACSGIVSQSFGGAQGNYVCGTVISIDTTAHPTTGAAHGVSKTYKFASSIVVYYNDAVSTLLSIAPAMNLTLALASAGVTVVAMRSRAGDK